jgi:hypothetical protein
MCNETNELLSPLREITNANCEFKPVLKPFFNLTLQAGSPRVAAIFVPKCTGLEPGETINMYEKCGMRIKAAEEAVRLKNVEAWERLLEAAGRGSQEGREIERLGNAAFKK